MGKPPAWATRIEDLLESLQDRERECSRIADPLYREAALASYAAARRKYEGELRTYEEALRQGRVVMDSLLTLPFRESAGLRLSRFFCTMRDEARILALRCPRCSRVIFPPRPACGFCRVTLGNRESDWFFLEDTGTITSIVIPTEREVDRATGNIVGEPNPCAFIRLDGGDEWTVWVHYLECAPLESLQRGRRVKAVWKPVEQRRGRLSDIHYFQLLEENP